MRTLLIITFNLLSSITMAIGVPASDISLSCESPFTVFHIQTKDSRVKSTVLHPEGIAYTGMYKGSLAMDSLVKIQKQAEILKQLGIAQTFIWPIDKCLITEDARVFSCTDGEKFELGGIKIRPVMLRTMVNNLKMTTGDFEVYTVSVVFLVEDQPGIPEAMMFEITSDYPYDRACSGL